MDLRIHARDILSSSLKNNRAIAQSILRSRGAITILPSALPPALEVPKQLDPDWRSKARPIQPGSSYPAKEFCSNCGLCDTHYVAHVKDACAFLGDGMSKIETMEPRVHGRSR